MDRIEYYRRLFDYDDWANREVLKSVRAASGTAGSASALRSLRLFAHILAAEWLWLGRMGVSASDLAVWPELALDQCEASLGELRATWVQYFNQLSSQGPESLERAVDYRNSKGEHWKSRVEDILLHVVMHSAQHRGQIAIDVRTGGATPAYVDFIQAVRTGAIR
jgi:uncharacterized damage-inducible protein DinB